MDKIQRGRTGGEPTQPIGGKVSRVAPNTSQNAIVVFHGIGQVGRMDESRVGWPVFVVGGRREGEVEAVDQKRVCGSGRGNVQGFVKQTEVTRHDHKLVLLEYKEVQSKSNRFVAPKFTKLPEIKTTRHGSLVSTKNTLQCFVNGAFLFGIRIQVN